MALKKATTKKVYAADQLSILRILSSGIKLSKAVADKMEVSFDNDSKIQFAKDDETNKIYIFAPVTEEDGGSKLGRNNCFTSSQLDIELRKMANAVDLEVKGGTAIYFNVAEEALVEGEDSFYELTFNKIVTKDEEGEEDEETVEENTTAEEDLEF